MKRNIGKIIEIAILIAGILLTVAVVVAIPLNSYYEHKAYREKLIELSKPEPKPVLESLTVQLKEGVTYFNNGLAEPKADDFIVAANYTLDGAPYYTEEVPVGKFVVSTAPGFYAVGGDVNISYKGKTEVFVVELTPIKIEALNVTQNPYTVKYQAGTTFNAQGLIISAVYNDGSVKVIPADKYEIDTQKQLTTADTSISVGYTEGGQTQTVAVPIGVVDVLDNGAVTKLILTGDAIVQAGKKLSETQMEINAVYESGNRLPLDRAEYVISDGNTIAAFGKAYTVSVSYAENPAVSISTGVIVRSTLQGESATITGGGQKGETEYTVVDGVITSLNKITKYAGDFGKTVLNGGDASLTLQLTSESAVIGNVVMRCGNSYCCYANGMDGSEGYVMKPLQINTILDLIVNGEVVEIPDSVVLKGSGPHANAGALYNIYYDVVFENIAFEPGENTIKIKFKSSLLGAVTCWGESPSTLNIDCVTIDSVGHEIPDDFVIEKIAISPNYSVQVNQRFDRIKPTVYAVLADGTKVRVSQDLFDFSVAGGEEGATRIAYGKYTVTATLKSNPEVTATSNIESVGVKVLKADIVQEGDKIYYVFSGTHYGCTAEDLQFFDGTTVYDLICEFTDTTFTFKIDVTLLTPGVTVHPHLKVRGANYYNGGQNENGDIIGADLVAPYNKEITFNGQIYKLVRSWSMPALQIFAAN